MSTQKLQQTIIKKVSILQDEELLQTVLKILQQKIRKATSPAKQKNFLPPHIKKAIGESLSEIKNGNFVDTLPDEEVSIVNSIQKMKKLNYVHTA